jgi:hypothetical protein
MQLLHRKSTWEKLIEPVSSVEPKSVAKSGLTAISAFVAMSIASAAISAVRQRRENA